MARQTAHKLTIAITLGLEPDLLQKVIVAGGREIDLVLPPDGKGTIAFWPSDREREAIEAGLDIEAVARAQVVLSALTPQLQERLQRCPAPFDSLRWLQLTTAGADRVSASSRIPADALVTTTRGVHARPIAEFVLAGVLSIVKRLPDLQVARRARTWVRVPPDELEGKTFGIIGLGGIGREVARLAKSFGCRVIATRRTTVAAEAELAERTVLLAQLPDLLRESDVVVLSLPLTSETFGMIGAREFDLMKPDAILVNVGRGGLVEEGALVDALRARRIGAAVLDVFAEEPLPLSSPLWDLDDVLVSPHVAGGRYYNRRVVEFFAANLRRYLSGQPLTNVETH